MKFARLSFILSTCLALLIGPAGSALADTSPSVPVSGEFTTDLAQHQQTASDIQIVDIAEKARAQRLVENPGLSSEDPSRLRSEPSASAGTAAPFSTGEYDRFCVGINGTTTYWPSWQAPQLCQGMMDVYISGSQVAHYNPYLVYLVQLNEAKVSVLCLATAIYYTITLPAELPTPAGWALLAFSTSLLIASCP